MGHCVSLPQVGHLTVSTAQQLACCRPGQPLLHLSLCLQPLLSRLRLSTAHTPSCWRTKLHAHGVVVDLNAWLRGMDVWITAVPVHHWECGQDLVLVGGCDVCKLTPLSHSLQLE